MKLVIMRHGEAGEPWSSDDMQRPLTAAGHVAMAAAARGLSTLLPLLHAVYSSPLLRTAQTAAHLVTPYAGLHVHHLDLLKPGASPTRVAAWLTTQTLPSVIAVVGHAPDMGALVSWCLCGAENSFVPLDKGAAALLDCRLPLTPGGAQLKWLLNAEQLGRMTFTQ